MNTLPTACLLAALIGAASGAPGVNPALPSHGATADGLLAPAPTVATSRSAEKKADKKAMPKATKRPRKASRADSSASAASR